MSTIKINAQSGAVLVMSLVMLTVLTIIGVSSMQSSSLEIKVASNMQQRNIAFQAAQSRIAFASADDPSNPVNFLVVVPEGQHPVQTCNSSDNCPDQDGEWTATAEVTYKDCGKGLGNSLEAGKGFSYRHFEVVAEGRSTSGPAHSVQASALRFPVKACGNEL